MTRKEAARLNHQEAVLCSLGFTVEEAEQLRRISMTLHRWAERCCGDDGGCIEVDDDGTAHWYNAWTSRRYRVPNRGAGAGRRLAVLMAAHPTLSAYIQGDPRGCALYILRPGDVPEGQQADSYYNRGIAVY